MALRPIENSFYAPSSLSTIHSQMGYYVTHWAALGRLFTVRKLLIMVLPYLLIISKYFLGGILTFIDSDKQVHIIL